MERSSMSLSTTWNHNGEEDGGKIKNHEPLADERGQSGEDSGGKSERSPHRGQGGKRSIFGALRGKAADLHDSVLQDSTLSSSDAGKSKGKKVRKVRSEAKLKVVANDKSEAVEKSESLSDDNGDQVEQPSRPVGSFTRGDYLVHPAHGVGYVRGVEAEEISGVRLDMIAISFEQERMVVRVPTCEYENCGLRSVSSPETMEGIYDTLKTKRRIRKTMWGRRAQEYDNKIRSGDPVRLAQVVRELYRGEEQPSPSYSERQYYQLALERLSREVAVVEKIEAQLAVEKLETILAAA